MWSGHAPIVKLGEVLMPCPPAAAAAAAAIWCDNCEICCCVEFGVAEVIGEDVFDDEFDSCAPNPFIGDFEALLSGDIWLRLRNSQFLQSISARFGMSTWSGHAMRVFCCCCCDRNSLSVFCCSRKLVSCERSAWEFRNFKSPGKRLKFNEKWSVKMFKV